MKIEGDSGAGCSKETEAQKAGGRLLLQDGVPHPRGRVQGTWGGQAERLLRESVPVSDSNGVLGR